MKIVEPKYEILTDISEGGIIVFILHAYIQQNLREFSHYGAHLGQRLVVANHCA